jgi:hypothetical protein
MCHTLPAFGLVQHPVRITDNDSRRLHNTSHLSLQTGLLPHIALSTGVPPQGVYYISRHPSGQRPRTLLPCDAHFKVPLGCEHSGGACAPLGLGLGICLRHSLVTSPGNLHKHGRHTFGVPRFHVQLPTLPHDRIDRPDTRNTVLNSASVGWARCHWRWESRPCSCSTAIDASH